MRSPGAGWVVVEFRVFNSAPLAPAKAVPVAPVHNLGHHNHAVPQEPAQKAFDGRHDLRITFLRPDQKRRLA